MAWQAFATAAASMLASKAIDRGSDYLVDKGADKLGLTTPDKTAAQLGGDQRAFMGAAFPGTNPWEQLGNTSPAGPIELQRREAKVKQAVSRRETGVQRENVGTQTAAQVKIAEISGRAKAAEVAGQYEVGSMKKIGDYITKGSETPDLGTSATTRSSFAAQLQSWTNENLQRLKEKEFTFRKGFESGDPATATLIAMASQAYDQGIKQTDLIDAFKIHLNKLRAAGVGVKLLSGLGKFLNVHILNLFQGRSGRGAVSVPGQSSSGAANKSFQKTVKPKRRKGASSFP